MLWPNRAGGACAGVTGVQPLFHTQVSASAFVLISNPPNSTTWLCAASYATAWRRRGGMAPPFTRCVHSLARDQVSFIPPPSVLVPPNSNTPLPTVVIANSERSDGAMGVSTCTSGSQFIPSQSQVSPSGPVPNESVEPPN